MDLFIKNIEDIEFPKNNDTVTLFIDAKTLELKGKSDKNELLHFTKEVEVMVHPNYSDITATPEDVTVGKIFIDQNGAFVVGTKEEASAGSTSNGPKLDDNGQLPLTLLALQAESSVTLSLSGIASRPGIQYRTTGETEWKPYECGTEITFSSINEYVQFRNTEEVLSTDNNKIVYFTMTGKIAGSGNLQSMLNYSESVPNWAFYRMFAGCTSLITSPEMPGKFIGELCYPYMFDSCTNMIYGPSILPIETMGHSCCNFMFVNCTSLIIPPDLPCKTLANYCYSAMFKECTSLERTPLKLPATTLANNCYKSMFDGCTSLEEAMEILPAETLTQTCYSTMFRNCERLVSAPKLPAKTLLKYSYSQMFSGCKSLRFIAADFTNYSAQYAIQRMGL
jgi:hypothetical protein